MLLAAQGDPVLLITQFLNGASALASCVIGLFFLRFHRRTRDRFFLMFSLSFFVMAMNTIILALFQPKEEFQTYLYFVRFLAFALILAAVIDKNRSRKTMY